jgi:predicted GNAT family N-acyltransferase
MANHSIDDAVGAEDMAAAFAIRREVFCGEQGVPEHEEMDGLDELSRHYLVRRGGLPIGTARVRRLSGGAYKVERVAIRKPERGSGLGRQLMLKVIADIARAGGRHIVLNAQLAVRDFYAGIGFAAEGGVFEEAGIPHIKMTRTLDETSQRATIRDS